MEQLAEYKLITNEISLKNNKLPVGEFSIAPKFTRTIGINDDNTGFMELTVEIINTQEASFPIDLKVSMTGVFNLTNIPEDQRDDFLKITAVQVVFPYVRSLVSNVTAGAMMPPIILPVIDVRKLFSEAD